MLLFKNLSQRIRKVYFLFLQFSVLILTLLQGIPSLDSNLTHPFDVFSASPSCCFFLPDLLVNHKLHNFYVTLRTCVRMGVYVAFAPLAGCIEPILFWLYVTLAEQIVFVLAI